MPNGDRSYPVPAFECKLDVAAIYFARRHWPEAADWFLRAAVEHPGERSAARSMIWNFEALDLIAKYSQPPREICRQALADEMPLFRCMFCVGQSLQSPHDVQCEQMTRLAAQLAEQGFAPTTDEMCARR